MPHPRQHLLCTIGTSLFFPNLNGVKEKLQKSGLDEELCLLAEAYRDQRWSEVAAELAKREPQERLCGAEINSITSLLRQPEHPVAMDCGLFFFHSATSEGRHIAEILKHYYQGRGHAPVETREIADLQDQDPKRFRTKGLRNLARELCQVVRQYGSPQCAFNATGGYKAQIAIAVLLGQALGIPVYYMHERFSDIIAFPPLPISLDFELWMRASGLLQVLDHEKEPVPRAAFEDEWDERYESLVDIISIDNQPFLELSATGQIFHDTFRERFRTQRDIVLPPAALPGSKQRARFNEKEAHLLAYRDRFEPLLHRLTQEVPSVVLCRIFYFNPDLPEKTRFKEAKDEIVGMFSNGTWTVKFIVETTATTVGQRAAMVAVLNDWLEHHL